MDRRGAGKTTVLRSLNRLITPEEGSIKIGEREVRTLHTSELRGLRRQVGMVFQDYNLIENLSVVENVLHGCLGRKSPLAGMLGWYRPAERDLAMQLVEKVGLQKYALKACRELSGGQKQRVGIARALMQQPRLLLGDDPIASLDPKSATKAMRLFAQAAIERQLIVLVNLHQVEIAKTYAQHIVGLNQGRVVFDGSPTDLTASAVERIYQN